MEQGKKIETNTSTINETIGARAWLQNAPQIITIIVIAQLHTYINAFGFLLETVKIIH